MLKHITRKTPMIMAGGLFWALCSAYAYDAYGFACSGSLYNNTSFEQRVSDFSPYDKIYLVVECTDLQPGEYTMHANWTHQKRGIIRSDKHAFSAVHDRKHGIFFWLKLSKKGPMASMLSNQDFHEKNFGEWVVETYLNNTLILSNEFTITDD